MVNKQLNLTDLARLYNKEDTVRELFERLRWPDGPICLHCKSKEIYRLESKLDSKSPGRKGLLKCKKCRRQFTVTVNTIFEGSHVPLNKWLMAIHLFCASKKGMSAHQLHRMLGITYKTAWFMAHRIRYAITQPPLADKLKGIVEADETYVGGKSHGKRGRGAEKKTPVFSLVERNGRIKSQPVEDVTWKRLKTIVRENVDKTAIFMTDEFPVYYKLGKEFKGHEVIDHGKKEYVRGRTHVNTVEGYFSILKRGINGTFHHVSKNHLHRYVSEFDFRYNYRKIEDGLRTAIVIKHAEGKKQAYRD